DLTGLIVDGLTRTIGSPRLSRNGAVSAAEAGRCVGDPTHRDYGAHGGVDLRQNGAADYPQSAKLPLLQIKTNLAKANQLSSSRTRIWPVLGRCQSKPIMKGVTWDLVTT